MGSEERACVVAPSLEEVVVHFANFFNSLSLACHIPPELKTGTFDDTILQLRRCLEKGYVGPPGNDLSHIVLFCFCAGHWSQYKAAFTFDPYLMRALTDTEEAPVYREVLKRLPFSSFFVYVPDGANTAGYLVTIETPDDTSDTLVACTRMLLNNTDRFNFENQGAAIWFPDGYTISQAMLTSPEVCKAYGGAEMLDIYKPVITPAIMAAYYLCAENAAIRPLKSVKSRRPKQSNGKPLNIKKWEVTFRDGADFDRMYSSSEPQEEKKYNRINSVRPHIRRAHWHHYWVGPGRATLVVKWIAPTFVMGKPADMPTVNHAVGF